MCFAGWFKSIDSCCNDCHLCESGYDAVVLVRVETGGYEGFPVIVDSWRITAPLLPRGSGTLIMRSVVLFAPPVIVLNLFLPACTLSADVALIQTKKSPEKPERIRIRFPGCYRHLPDSPDCLDFPMHSLCKTPPGQFQDRE